MSAHQLKRARHKVAVVVPKYGLVGGGERFASEITERLAADGAFDIHVFANKWVEGSSPITFHKVPIVRFPRFLRPLSFAMYAGRMIGKGGFDLVHSHERLLSADIFSLHCVPHAGWVRDVRKKRPSGFDLAMISVEKRMLAHGSSSWFLPVSTIAMEAFRREYGELPGTWKPMHPGVDLKRFSTPPLSECRAEVRERNSIGHNDFLILFVGMNFEVKGLDTVIKALALSRAAAPGANIRLLVVGRGDEEKYKKMAAGLGVDGAVSFAGVRSEGLERYYRAADLFAMPSKYDTFGMVVLEAMASGKPVLISGNVGAKDLVEEGVNGFVLKDGEDPEAAATRINALLDERKRRSMGEAALKTAARNDWSVLAERMKALYWDVLSRKGLAETGTGNYREARWTSR